MKQKLSVSVQEAKRAALEVLLHNLRRGRYRGLPRTAGWGYPEPYTRDLMISSLGMLVSGNEELVAAVRKVLQAAAKNQTRLGHIPSLVHDPEGRGASDTTPLFLLALACYRKAAGETDFLEEAAQKAMTWMDYQSPVDRVIVAQLPTSDWRDEQWVVGYGVFVNTIVYSYLRMFNEEKKASMLKTLMGRFADIEDRKNRGVPEGLVIRYKPYYALWSYKIYKSERYSLLGNSLAILSGVASRSRARSIIRWTEVECGGLRQKGQLAVDLPPNLFPYIREKDPDWFPRYARFNKPGTYHNGGVWPFICGFYVAAIVAAGFQKLAERKLEALTQLVRPAREANVAYGFNEWIKAQNGKPCGQDWQTWSAAMYLFAAACVEKQQTPFFDEIRWS